MMDDDKGDDRAAAGLSDNRRGGGAMAESNVCRLERLGGRLDCRAEARVSGSSSRYDSALASDRAMERLLEDIRRCSDTKVRETLILWLDRQIDEAKLPVKH
jgi:hypothetical protein